MKQIKKIVVLSLLISLLIPYVAYGYNEGLLSAGGNGRTKDIWMYCTGEYDEDGEPIFLFNQWKQVWDYWYYFGEDGKSIQNSWKEIDGKWYYFDQWSIMLHDTTTPDGYYVGSDGAWVQEEVVAQ